MPFRLPDNDHPDGEGSPPFTGESTFRQLAVRWVALVLLFSLLGSWLVALRGIKDVLVVIGLLLAVAGIAAYAKRQQAAENPYRSDSPSDPEIH